MASVLIIDDSPTETHLYTRALEKHGFQVSTANDGEAGIRQAIEQQPDIILMDVVMPGVNGFQATREIHRLEATAEIPIIIITTKGQETDRIWGMRQGAVEYLVKPVSKRALVRSVKSVLAKVKRTNREAAPVGQKTESAAHSAASENTDSEQTDPQAINVCQE